MISVSGYIYVDGANRHLNLEGAITSTSLGCSDLAEAKQTDETEIGLSTDFGWCDFEEASEGSKMNTDAESELDEGSINSGCYSLLVIKYVTTIVIVLIQSWPINYRLCTE